MALAEVKMLPFTRGKKQLEKIGVDWSLEVQIVHIHVERVVGVIKQKYTILQGTIPITTLDKIVIEFVVHWLICVHQ